VGEIDTTRFEIIAKHVPDGDWRLQISDCRLMMWDVRRHGAWGMELRVEIRGQRSDVRSQG
jgi:hypothetical protein